MNGKTVKIIFFLTFFFGVKNSFATNTFLTREFLCDSCNKDLNLRFESSSFFKNNEYESDFATGFTGIGVMFKPTLEYYFNKSTKLNFGAFGLKYSGLDGLSQLVPIYQIHHKVTNGFELVFGSLYGNLNHDLAEPLYRFDRYYLDNVEYGVQILNYSEFIDSDLWLNWEQFILEGDPFQEEFTLGNHSKIKFLNKKRYQVAGDCQLLIYHKGGEIDSYNGPAFSLFNGSYGFDFSLKSQYLSYSIRPKILVYKSLGLPDEGENYKHYKNGNGFLFSGDIEHDYFYFESGYWSGNKFVSSSGEYLYMSIAESDLDFHQDNRQLFFTKFRLKRHMSNNLKLELRMNLYVDLRNDVLPDYSFGVYFIANELFFLKKDK
tara:strand:+ start:22317 stop:23444 length:1128 start_codon:yes stop_codon:yes gene_type:complete